MTSDKTGKQFSAGSSTIRFHNKQQSSKPMNVWLFVPVNPKICPHCGWFHTPHLQYGFRSQSLSVKSHWITTFTREFPQNFITTSVTPRHNGIILLFRRLLLTCLNWGTPKSEIYQVQSMLNPQVPYQNGDLEVYSISRHPKIRPPLHKTPWPCACCAW